MFWELFFEHLRAAGRVLGTCCVNTLGRQGVFWGAVFRSPQGGTACFGELLFQHFTEAQRVLGIVF